MGGRLWKVLVVVAIQVEHTEEGMTERGLREGTCDQSFCIRSSVSWMTVLSGSTCFLLP